MNNISKNKLSKLVEILLAILPAVIVFVLIIFEPFYSLDAMLCDAVYTQMNGTGDDIKLICIDEETLAEYGPLTSWSRDKSAELIDVLYADSDNAPAVLAYDIMFIGDADSEKDSRLAEAASRVDHLVVASNLVYRGKTRYRLSGAPYYDKRNIDTEERPYTELDLNAASGFANVALSKDGFVRIAQISAEVDGETRYSFPVRIYQEYLDATGTDITSDMVDVSKLPSQIDFFYSGKPGEMIRYSMKDVLEGRIPAEAFDDSIVLVGAYAPGLQDSYHSAAKRVQDMYGVEINANIVRALMTGKTATHIPAIIVAIIAAIVIFLYTYMARAMKMYPALIMGIWVILADGIIGRILAVNGHLMSLVYVLIVVLIIMAWVIIEKYVLEIVKKKRVLNTFRKYMAPQVIDNLAKDEAFKIELGGERRNVAVLFVDIRGFTTMSEAVEPEVVVSILNRYLNLTTSCIFDNGGMLDKFIGDATMAIFNAPNNQEDYIYQAVKTGLAMQKGSKELGRELLENYGHSINIGVGINVGDAVVGNIGCDTRMDYTAIGDTVNTAARLESRAQAGEVLISEAVYKALEGRITAEFKEEMALKGKTETVRVYNVTDVL